MDLTRVNNLILTYTNMLSATLPTDEALAVASGVLHALLLGPGHATKSILPPFPVAAITQSPQVDSKGDGPIMFHAGYKCHCYACKKDVYEFSVDLPGRNVGINKFLQAFKPIGNSPAITRDFLNALKDADDNTYIDCPVCKSKSTLQILGKGKPPSIDPIATEDSTVQSIGHSDVEGL